MEAGDADTVSAYKIAEVVEDILRCDKNDFGVRFSRRQVANSRLIKGRIRSFPARREVKIDEIRQPGRIAEKVDLF